MADSNQQDSNRGFTITLPILLEKWISHFPKSIIRAALLFFALGIGFGFEITGANLAISWFKNRPLPQKVWSESSFDAVGLKAKLSTKWEGFGNSGDELKYRLSIKPSDPSHLDDFNRIFSDHGFDKITVNLYDKSGFRVYSGDIHLNEFTRELNDAGKRDKAIVQGKFFVTPDEYKSLSGWDFSTNLPLIQTANNSVVSSNPVINRNDKSSNPDLTGEDVNHQNKDKQAARNISIEGDDVISGFSFVSGQIETSGGLTFFVFKEGERTNAAVWGMNSMRIHYLCDNKSICKLSHVGSDVVLHAKLRK